MAKPRLAQPIEQALTLRPARVHEHQRHVSRGLRRVRHELVMDTLGEIRQLPDDERLGRREQGRTGQLGHRPRPESTRVDLGDIGIGVDGRNR